MIMTTRILVKYCTNENQCRRHPAIAAVDPDVQVAVEPLPFSEKHFALPGLAE